VSRAFPPCGFVAGLYARTDATRGVWKEPAGTEASLAGAKDMTVVVGNTDRDQLNRRGVNCLRKLSDTVLVVWGARTLADDNASVSDRGYVPVRRLALFIEDSLYAGTKWAAFEPNGEPLWARLRASIDAFMHELFTRGAFVGNTPSQAWFVKCDATTTTLADIDNGVVNIVIGFAPIKPAEFVIITITLRPASS
jgi:hypothetical protein